MNFTRVAVIALQSTGVGLCTGVLLDCNEESLADSHLSSRRRWYERAKRQLNWQTNKQKLSGGAMRLRTKCRLAGAFHRLPTPLFDVLACVAVTTLILMLFTASARATPTITFVTGPSGDASDPTIPVGSPIGNVFFTLSADLQGDGRRDLILLTGSGPPIVQRTPMRILRPNAAGTGMTDVTRKLLGNGALPSMQHPREVDVADFNGDGKLDIFVAAHGYDAAPFPGERNVLLISRGDGTYSDQSATLPSAPDFSHSTTIGDINGDGIPDIFVGNLPLPQKAYFLIGKGDGTFAQATNLIPADLTSPNGSTFLTSLLVDVDGDGFPDLVLGSFGDGLGRNVILLNDGTGDFTKRPRVLLPVGVFGATATVDDILSFDVNGDGRPDLLILSTQSAALQDRGAAIQVLINRGNGVFTDETQVSLGASTSRTNGIWWTFLRAVDLNGDGLLDFYAKGFLELSSSGAIESVPMIWLNNGDGTFTAVNSGIFPNVFTPMDVVDVDGDGQLDFVAAYLNSSGVMQYRSFLNRTPRTVPSEPIMVSATSGDGQAHVAFSKPLGSGVAPITKYTVTCNARAVATSIVASGSASPITVTGLTNGKRYSCTVTATNSAGTSLPSATTTVAPAAVVQKSVTVVEYYNISLDAYFITGHADDQATLDGLPASFKRTGMSFQATTLDSAPVARIKICRFYVSLANPYVSSHFYGRQGADCEGIREQNLPGFNWEGYDFAVQSATESCAAPIYRSFRPAANGKTSNHRYSAGLADYTALSVAGAFAGEGAVFCAAALTPVARSAMKNLFDPTSLACQASSGRSRKMRSSLRQPVACGLRVFTNFGHTVRGGRNHLSELTHPVDVSRPFS